MSYRPFCVILPSDSDKSAITGQTEPTSFEIKPISSLKYSSRCTSIYVQLYSRPAKGWVNQIAYDIIRETVIYA